MVKKRETRREGTAIGSLVVWGYATNARKVWVWRVLSVLSLGFIPSMFHWRPSLSLKAKCDLCFLKDATHILVQDVYGQIWVEEVNTLYEKESLYFEHKKITYVWDNEIETFLPLCGISEELSCNEILDTFGHGLSTEEAASRLHMFGHNVIEVHVKSYVDLITGEALNPFYFFQLYAVIVWLAQSYALFAVCIILMTIGSIGVTVHETRKQSLTLREKVRSVSKVSVYRKEVKNFIVTTSDQLVPGDVIEVCGHAQDMMECDAILLNGSVIVNESMLTGESVPVTKMCLPDGNEIFSPGSHKRHLLFCGTQVLQTHSKGQEKIKALVIRTGFSTAKGELVRSILFPKPVDMKFYTDSMKFAGISAGLGVLAMIYTAISYTVNGTNIKEIIVSALDIITFVVPPSLPACMTIGNVYGQKHLKKHGIFCLSSKYINISGTLNLAAFDKTGTLTRDGLDLEGIVSVDDTDRLGGISGTENVTNSSIIAGMATCHSLVIIDGKVAGDPLDLIMFESTEWELDQVGDWDKYNGKLKHECNRVVKPKSNFKFQQEYFGIVHQYPFLSNLQRMSVIVETSESNELTAYVKGSPEMIASLCLAETIPTNISSTLDEFTRAGSRVIALACKNLRTMDIIPDNLTKIDRKEIETDLTFLGLLILQNRLKPETIPALEELRQADIRCLMVTGDNLLTAVHTACSCGMVGPDQDVIITKARERPGSDKGIHITYQLAETADAERRFETNVDPSSVLFNFDRSYCFAMDGETFSLVKNYDNKLLQNLVQRGIVFARMLPDLKVQLVEELQELGYLVCMCGDGANDCGALKTANTGVSLSTAEASVASPFTATQANISSIPTLIKEGRCALVTSFSLFKHLLGSSWASAIIILILYNISCDFTDLQYTYVDMALIVYPTILFGNIQAFPRLSSTRPPAYLAAFGPVFSLITFIIIQTAVFATVWRFTWQQPWFKPWAYHETDVIGYENTIMFTVFTLNPLISSIVFCQGPPYRKTLLSNKLFIFSMVILSGLNVWMLLYPPHALTWLFSLKDVPSVHFKLILLLICTADFFLCLLIEDMFINKYLHPVIIPKVKRWCNIYEKHELIEMELQKRHDWPPLRSSDA